MERDLSRITISVIVLDFELDMAGPVLLHGVKITITYRVVQLASIEIIRSEMEQIRNSEHNRFIAWIFQFPLLYAYAHCLAILRVIHQVHVHHTKAEILHISSLQ